jgi:hypothetical protein
MHALYWIAEWAAEWEDQEDEMAVLRLMFEDKHSREETN